MTISPTRIGDLSPEDRRALLARLLQQKADSTQPEFPLTWGQQALWFLHESDPSSYAYNVGLATRIRVDPDRAALHRALQSLVDRHAALRTTFKADGGVPMQVVHPAMPVAFEVIPIPDVDADAYSRQVDAAVQQPFDLEHGPVFRAFLFEHRSEGAVLLLSMHHIAGDGWSCGLLMDELAVLYAAECDGRPAVLTGPSRQYRDFVTWQTQLLTGAEGARHRAYWHQKLADDLPRLDLPTDRPRPAMRAGHGATLGFTLDEDLAARLRALARAERTSLYTLLLSAFQVLLHRYTGQDDMLIGSPLAGRSRAEFHQTVGYFVSPVVVRGDLSGDPTFTDLVGRVRRTVHEAIEHQDYPFPLLVKELRPARDPGRSPVFDVMFNLLKLERLGLASASADAAAGQGGSSGLYLEPFPLRQEEGQFDLFLEIGESDRALFGAWKYDTALFDRATIEHLNANFQVVLRGIVEQPEQPISELPLLSGAEHERLAAWNSTAAAYPDAACIHELVEAQVRRTPQATAAVFESERLTYDELNTRANRLARHLRDRGAGEGTFVALYLERSLDMLVGMLGVLKAGAAYLPLDPTYPTERLAFMLGDSRAALVVTNRTRGAQLELLAPDAGIIHLIDDEAAISGWSGDDVQPVATAESPAYAIYTSGSTGTPKGVLVPHRAVVNFLCSMGREPGLSADDTLLAVTTLSFDIAVLELLLPLTVGARVVIASRAVAADGALLGRALAESGATVMQATPMSWRLLLESGWQPPHSASGRRFVALCGGEPLPRTLASALLARGCDLWNMYGPTETTVWSSCQRITDADGPLSIGRPIANTQIHVLDRHLQRVPIGVAGELYIGGDGVSSGYLHRQALTAERFVADPFSDQANARLYRTGDLARWRADGTLEHLGRLDTQVKLRGFRIELGEIESVLAGHPAVAQAVCAVRDDVPGDLRLVAYVVPHADVPCSLADLREHLKATLPDYMIPASFVSLERIPVTPNGKLDRAALPAPSLATLAREHVEPRTLVEETLTGIWADVLNCASVGATDDFFELGGHSLLAARVISRARAAFDIELPLSSLFEAPTVSGQARHVESALRFTTADIPAPTPAGRDLPLPLAFAQERMWYLEQVGPGRAGLGMPVSLRLQGSLDISALERSLREIIRRHEALRTSFTAVDGRPTQVVAPEVEFAMSVVDLTGLSRDQRDAEAGRISAVEFAQPFDLGHPLLMRASLVRIDTDEHLLLLSLHHIAFDGWSLTVLTAELEALYEAFTSGQPSPLPELPFQYADYAVWQRNVLAPAIEDQIAYWRQQLDGCPPLLDLPTDRPRPRVRTFRGQWARREISETLTAALRSLSAREGTTPFMTLLAAFKLLLARQTGQEDIVVGTPVAGRTRSELEGLIGVFLNMLVLRTDTSGNPTFHGLVKRVRDVALGAYSHQDVPFERLLADLHPQRDTSRTPLFQVLFNMLPFGMKPPQLSGMSVELAAPPEIGANFDLTLYAAESDGRFQLSLVYNADLFDADRMAELLRQYVFLLEQIVADPGLSLADYSLRTPEAETQLPDPTAPLQPHWQESVHARFVRQAREHPDALAVTDGRDSWTYADLEERSRQLAHRLRCSGIGTEDIVAIYGQRSLSLATAILGILRAGAAFTILDPDYPAARLVDRLEIAQPVGWIQLEAEQELPAALREHVAQSVPRCQLVLSGPQATDTHDRPDDWAAASIDQDVGPDDLAYVTFTSGTTGSPRAIAGTHRPLAHFMSWHADTFGLTASDRFSMLSGLSHDPLLRDMFAPLWVGATLTMPAPAHLREPELLRSWLRERRVTVTHLTPSLSKLIVGSADEADVLPDLRRVFFGGEPLTEVTVANLGRLAPDAVAVNFYGATETPQAMAYTPIERPIRSADEDAVGEGRSIPIGSGIDGVQLLVRNASGQLAGVGERGEISIRTPYLARGYLHDDALTSDRFIPNPFTETPDDRLYRTGDLGRYRPDGQVEFAGRGDEQVKVRGFRIELGDVEAAIERLDGVGRAVAVVREDVPGNPLLVAYVIPEQRPDRSSLSAGQLRSHLATELPSYMMPASFVTLASLPLTPNGKVDRRRLPPPDRPHEESIAEPRDEIEARLVEIWQELLGTTSIGVNDNFFDLGGHSLLAVQLFSRVRDIFGRNLPLTTLLEDPTIEHVARTLRRHVPDAPWSTVVPIQTSGSKPPLFCVHGLGGYVSCFAELARRLGPDQPFFGIQALGLDGVQEPLTRVEDMAARYIAEIRTVQPEGPYYLAGFSSGGAIALEMAQQLQASQEEVRLLAMVDCAPRTLADRRQRWKPRSFRHLLQELPFWKDVLCSVSNAERVAAGRFAWSFLTWSLKTKLGQRWPSAHPGEIARALEERAAIHLPEHHRRLRLILRQAAWEYAPKPYRGRITLLRSTRYLFVYSFDRRMGWEEVALDGVDVAAIPGDHEGILAEPQVEALAQNLRAYLTRAQQSHTLTS